MKEIFKYLKWDRGESTLLSNMLYLPSPDQFDDKYDCSFKGFSFVGKDTIVERVRGSLKKEIVYRKIAICVGVFSGTSSEWENTIDQILDGNDSINPFLYDLIWTLIPRLISRIKHFDPGDYQWAARKFLRVLCLCLDYNNTYLWENYAQNNSGLAIGLNYNILEQMPGAKIFAVNYSEDIPSYEFGKYTKEIAEEVLSTKLMRYKLENETRVIFHSEHKKYLNISSLVTSVTFGNKACVSDEFIWLLQKKYPNTLFFKMNETNENREQVVCKEKIRNNK